MPALRPGLSPYFVARMTSVVQAGAADAGDAGREQRARNFGKDFTAVELTL